MFSRARHWNTIWLHNSTKVIDGEREEANRTEAELKVLKILELRGNEKN